MAKLELRDWVKILVLGLVSVSRSVRDSRDAAEASADTLSTRRSRTSLSPQEPNVLEQLMRILTTPPEQPK